MPESDKAPPQEFSKTQRKKDMLALQKIGETLVRLAHSELENIPLPSDLREAIYFAQTLKTNEAKRRHLQFIGKLMREVDLEPIMLALKQMQFRHEKRIKQFHATERWREQLITAGDEALQDFLTQYPQAERQKLRQLVRKAQQDIKNNKDTGGTTMLFKYLREVLGE